MEGRDKVEYEYELFQFLFYFGYIIEHFIEFLEKPSVLEKDAFSNALIFPSKKIHKLKMLQNHMLWNLVVFLVIPYYFPTDHLPVFLSVKVNNILILKLFQENA